MSNPTSANPRCAIRTRIRRGVAPLVLLCACALAASSGCSLLWPDHELQESRRVADCRADAKSACYREARKDRTVKHDDCVSERSWQCALGNDSKRSDSKKK